MFCLLFLVLIALVSCSKDEENTYIFSSEECIKNWAICTLFPDREIKISNSRPIKVALLDSGIKSDLKGLEGKVIKKYNTLNNSSKTNPKSDHGTMIASIIASGKHEGINIGVNENIELLDVQVLDEMGNGKVEDVVSGVNWSVKQDVDIINLSFGFSRDDPRLKKAVKNANDKGIIIVAATGNTIGLSTDYPARYPEVLSISAIDKNTRLFSYSGKGKVDFVAPGVDVPVLNMGGEIERQNGTSFAAAYATGAISLLIQDGKKDIRENLKSNAKDLGHPKEFGYGLIQIKE